MAEEYDFTDKSEQEILLSTAPRLRMTSSRYKKIPIWRTLQQQKKERRFQQI